MSITYHGPKEFSVQYAMAFYGLIYLKITLDGKSFVTDFSEVYDPLYAFKYWLEAICIGVEQCSFPFDPEGEEIRFDFQRHWNDTEGIFTARSEYGEQIYLSEHVETVNLVAAFYIGFLRFAMETNALSDLKKPKTFLTLFKELFDIDEVSLIDILTGLDRRQLRKAFFYVDPWYVIRIYKIAGRVTMARRPHLQPINKNYDRWPEPEKRKQVEALLWMQICHYEGAGIDDFKSEIVEKFLQNRRSSAEVKDVAFAETRCYNSGETRFNREQFFQIINLNH